MEKTVMHPTVSQVVFWLTGTLWRKKPVDYCPKTQPSRTSSLKDQKFVHRIIVLAADSTLCGSICRLLKPPPLEEPLGEKHRPGSQWNQRIALGSRKR